MALHRYPALPEDQRRQTLLGNIANNLIAFGTQGRATSPADALMSARANQAQQRSLSLRDALSQRQEERLRMNQEMQQRLQRQEQARQAQAQGILAQPRGAGGVDTRVPDLTQAGFLQEATQLQGLQPKTPDFKVGAIRKFKEDGEEVTQEYVGNGLWKELGRGEGAGQTINILGEGPFRKGNEAFLADLVERRNTVLGTQQSYQGIIDAERMLEEGEMITGAGADWRLGFAKAANLLGADNDELIVNTETYGRSMGRQTAEIIKAFGAGTGLSDADREYAEGIAGGSIALNKGSMKRLVSLAKKYYKMGIEQYNRDATNLRKKDVQGNLLMDLSNIEIPKRIKGGSSIDDLLEKYR